MIKSYTFSTGESSKGDREQLERLLADSRSSLDNYLEVLASLDDDDYVARGNGFCDSRYSSDFIESQIDKYRQRIKEIEALLNATD